MSARSCRAFRIAIVAFLGLAPWLLADAQGGADSLQSQLTEKFKLAKLGTDSSGLSIIETGTVLVIKKGGILGVPPSASILIPSYVKDGQVKTANNTAMAGVNKLMSWKHVSDPTGTASTDTKFLTVDEKVYASKIDVNVKDSKVTLTIIECDSCNNVKDASSRRAQVVFQFPSGYLTSADGGQVADVVNQVLAFDTSSDSNQQAQSQDQQPQQQDQAAQQQAAAPAQAAPAAPAQPPPTIQLGQTTDEVTGLFGQPTKIINLGTKIIYVYKDMKVTFIKGKVTDVQ
jgi:hypothetical protein